LVELRGASYRTRHLKRAEPDRSRLQEGARISGNPVPDFPEPTAGTFAALIAIVLAFAAGLWHCQCGHDAEHRKVMRWMIRLLLDPTLTGRKDPPSPRN